MMTMKDKRELVRLLHLYEAELLAIDEKNTKADYFDKVAGVKAQYDHARIISTKLSTQISKHIHTM